MLRTSSRDPRTMIILLILIVVVMSPLDYYLHTRTSPQDPEEISKIPIGSTVVAETFLL